MKRVIAFDLGAGSYRAVEGHFSHGQLSEVYEIARFRHTIKRINGHDCWDMVKICEDIVEVLQKQAREGPQIDSVGIDSWGSDFGFLDGNDQLLQLPVIYRDTYPDGMREKFFTDIESSYQRIGGSNAGSTSALMLKGMLEKGFPNLEKAERLCMIPDLVVHFLTGVFQSEYTIATTTRLLNAERRSWDFPYIKNLGIPERFWGKIVMPGTVVGRLRPELVSGESNLEETRVVAVAEHDTASAVAVIPEKTGRAFISSGSWSVMGIVCEEPVLSKQAAMFNLENEGQLHGKIRLLRNITGLWMLEECLKEWKQEGRDIALPSLIEEASKIPSCQRFLYSNAERFSKNGKMPGKIKQFCKESGQPEPRYPAEFVRMIVDSLSMEYRKTILDLEEVSGKHIQDIYIVGGGKNNTLLSQCTADATGLHVICGPQEAAALGNIVVQLYGLGEITEWGRLSEIADSIRKEICYEPRDKEIWDQSFKRYLSIREKENR